MCWFDPRAVSYNKDHKRSNLAHSAVETITGTPSLGDWPPPTEQDLLGFSAPIGVICDRISEYSEECKKRPREPSVWKRIAYFFKGSRFHRDTSALSFGIYGEWGCGKTTLLKRLRLALEEDGIDTVWIDAWRYNQEKELWSALLQSVLTRSPTSRNLFYRPYVRFRLWWRTIDWKAGSWHLFTRVGIPLLRALILAILFLLALNAKKIVNNVKGLPDSPISWLSWEEIAQAVLSIAGIFVLGPTSIVRAFNNKLSVNLAAFRDKKRLESRVSFLDKFREEFQWIINLVYPKRLLVILIDDLDRCLPEVAVQIVEAVKLFLDVDRCIFVMGVNRELISEAIAARYKKSPNINSAEQDDEQHEHSELSGEALKTFGATYLDRIIQHSFSIPPLDAHMKRRLINALLPEPHRRDGVVDVFVQGLEGNPRKIKQAIHLYLMWFDLHQATQRTEAEASSTPNN